MVKQVHEVFALFEEAKTREEKIQVLKNNETWALKDIIKGSMDDKIQWLLPKGEVPYTKCEEWNHPTTLLKKNKDFKYVVKGGPGMSMPTYKREKIFLGILESIHPSDADLVCKMINKEKPVKGITAKLVEEAFPGLL
jgi:hypothetical protein|tara:strand:+ start:279 stop:692 length:414 start_codon:yes stop_codon:yes gene_type:complete